MSVDELHLKYAPVMRFSGGERFFPMCVDDFLTYSSLYVKGQDAPVIPAGQVTPHDLVQRYNSSDAFLRSVAAGPLRGLDVAAGWGAAAVRLLYDWSANPVVSWSEDLARSAYSWFSQKTRAATRLFWWNNLLLPKAFADSRSGERQDLPRFKLPPSVRDSAIEQYEASQARQRNYTYYYRGVQQAGYLDLQYWFFYAYNDWAGGYGGFNDHEGDWEGLHVFFELDAGQRPVEPPAYVCFLGHHSRITKPWNHPDVEKAGTHPVVYVAAGSHASYPQARQYPLMALYDLVDYATGESFSLDHADWQSRIDLDELPWLSTFLGSYGTRYWLSLDRLQGLLAALGLLGGLGLSAGREIDLPGVSAPRGPRFGDEGGERQTWSDPLAFAGIAQE